MCSKIKVPTNHLCLKLSCLSTMILLLQLEDRIKRKPQKKSPKELILSLPAEFVIKNKRKTKTNKDILTRSIIIASGATSIWLNAENEKSLRKYQFCTGFGKY